MLCSAQEPPPRPASGYATEGRPGFVAIADTETISWQRLNIPGLPPDVQGRILSQSSTQGAISLMVYLPIGWQREQKGYYSADEEIFLLEGDLTIGDQKFTKYSYAVFPEGMVQGPVSTRQGAVVLEFYNKKPDFVASETNKPGTRVRAAVRDWNYYAHPWDTVNFPTYRKGPPLPGARLKLLRNDPDTGEMTWINVNAVGGPTSGDSTWEVHPTFEEYFLLERPSGVVVGECLPNGPTPVKYGNRGYWWRPANVGHLGPLYSAPGYAMSLVRTGARLWAYYYTDCSYKQQIELSPEGKWVPAKKQ